MAAAIEERDAGACHELVRRARNQDLAGCRQGQDPGCRMDGDAADVVRDQFDLARVQAGPHLEPEFGDAVADRGRAADRARGPVEQDQKPIAGLLDLPAAEGRELEAGPVVVVGILVFDRAYITEFAGPLDVYHHVADGKVKVVLISGTKKDITTYEGLRIHTDYTVGNAPKIDILVVPSGAGSLEDDPKNKTAMAWIKKTAAKAKFITSHCSNATPWPRQGQMTWIWWHWQRPDWAKPG